MKVALVHDWITGLRGGERCLTAFLSFYPDADIFTLLHVPGSTTRAIDARVKECSFIQKIPGAKKFYRHLLPLYPLAIRKFNLSEYDLVISLSHAAAKNVTISNPKTRHISYCFTPMRYIWDRAYDYFGKLTPFIWPIIGSLRKWDVRGADGVTDFVAISDFVAARIRCFYGRDSVVIYPPVDTSWIKNETKAKFQQGEAFLYAGALVPYKKTDLIVEAFNQIGEPLWIVGTGPEEEKLKRMAGPNIHFIGHVPDRELAEYYANCRALIFPGKEDFGMVPVECLAAGRPVVGLFDGGLKETIVGAKPWDRASRDAVKRSINAPNTASDGFTGVFIKNEEDAILSSLISSIYYFIDNEEAFGAEACKKQAKKFSVEEFCKGWLNLVSERESRNVQSTAHQIMDHA